jgi:hypothetical protein
MFLFEYDPNTNPLNNNDWAYALHEILHISGFALSIGTIALVDLRLLGLALTRKPSSRVLRDTAPWSLVGIVIMLITGPLIFTSDPGMYLRNGSFKFKMVALLVAIVYNFTVHRKVALASGPASGVTKLTGAVSLALWVSVVFGGLFIAFV